MRHLLGITMVAVLATSAACPVIAQPNPAAMKPGTEKAPGKPAADETNVQDRLFVQLVGAGGAAEVNNGKLADGKARSPAVKEFARRMVQDHSKSNEQLAALGKQSGIALPTEPDEAQQAMRAELESAEGAAFDLAYLRGQLVDHQKTIHLLEWEIGSGQHAQLQRFASAALPTVLQHLEMVQVLLAEATGAAPQGLAAGHAMKPAELKATR